MVRDGHGGAPGAPRAARIAAAPRPAQSERTATISPDVRVAALARHARRPCDHGCGASDRRDGTRDFRCADRAAHRPVPDPELLHHRPHRPWQVDAGRPDARRHRDRRGPQHAGAVPRPDGHRARARHHDQGAERPAAVAAATCSTSSTPRATWTSPTRCPARWPPARGPSCWSTRRRGSRRRPWRTSTSRWRTTCSSSRSSTRSTCRPPSRTATPTSSRTSSAATRPT